MIDYKKIVKDLSEDEIWNLLDIVEALKHTDGFFTAVVIYDEKIKCFLGKHKLINTNSRGGSFQTKNLLEFEELLYIALDEFEEKS